MKFLIAIKNKDEESQNILNIGCKIAEGFSADLTICYVGKKSKAIIEGEVNLTRLSMSEWNIYHPGVDVLEWAFNILKNNGFTNNINFNHNDLREESDHIRLIIPQTTNYQIKLILREGDLLSELNNEIKQNSFDIAIIGAPMKKRMTQKIVQFLNTSIFFVKNFKQNFNYKILLCVDDSKASKRAVIFSKRISQQFNANITLITVSKTDIFGKDYKNAHNWAKNYLQRGNINYKSIFTKGNPVDIFLKKSGKDHIIIMGKAKKNEIIKFIMGSKPIHTAQKADCPIILIN